MREVILDTETTGLDPGDGHRIIEIGLLEVKNKVLTGRKFHHYLNPERDVPLAAYRIHGISAEFLADKPLFSDVVDEFLEFIADAKLVIHNAAFDMKFINHELSRLMKSSLDMSMVVDTLAIARRAFPGARVNLDALCKRLKIDNSHRTLHGALLDAEILYEVYIELTGGRQSTFAIASKNKAHSERATTTTGNQRIAGCITLQPTAEEIAAHQRLLLNIPNNVWRT